MCVVLLSPSILILYLLFTFLELAACRGSGQNFVGFQDTTTKNGRRRTRRWPEHARFAYVTMRDWNSLEKSLDGTDARANSSLCESLRLLWPA